MKPMLIAAAMLLGLNAEAFAQVPPMPPTMPSLPSISLAPLGNVHVGDIYHVCGTTQNIPNGSVVKISIIQMFMNGTFSTVNVDATVSGGAFCSADTIEFTAVGSFYLGAVYVSPGTGVVQANAGQAGAVLP